jgi:outer membrane receptor protein involved in Fe transport
LIGKFGTLDPTDGNKSDRWSVSGHYGATGDDWKLSSSAYVVHSTMVLWNDFTHYLDDPVNGDQEQQDETRTLTGGQIAYTRIQEFGNIETDTTVGLQDRYDNEYIDRRHTRQRVVLDYCNDGNGDYSVGEHACTADLVKLNDAAPYIENTTHWLPWLRTVVGAREDYSTGSIHSVLADFPFNGHASEFLFQPKGSIAFGPFYKTEFYYSAGKGFHSDDLRGVLGSVPIEGTAYSAGQVPLMAKTFGQEIGMRNASIPHVQTQLTVFRQDFSSEQEYDQDAGQDVATAPSRRTGVEASVQYRPANWIELNTDVDFTKARYLGSPNKLAGFPFYIVGGSYIANAPKYTASFGILVDNLGNWYGGLAERILGPQPLTDGAFSPSTRGYTETNLDIGYKFSPKLKAQFSIYNLLNSHAYSAEYYYATDITPAEVAKYGTTGVGDYQVHPLEPLSVRLTVTAYF